MSNPMFNPRPNYSGVTIQISNPAVYAGQCCENSFPYVTPCNVGVNQNGNQIPQGNYINYPQASYLPYSYNSYPVQNQNPENQTNQLQPQENVTNPIQQGSGYSNAYPAQYYLNNYNYAGDNNKNENKDTEKSSEVQKQNTDNNNIKTKTTSELNTDKNESVNNNYKIYAQDIKHQESDMTKSQNIIEDLSEREAKIQEEKNNTKETKIVALTDEYIKSLENYLNNPNDEIRLMASKEILTRLDEDKDRYDDAALNALLNKMMQDPNKLVRIAALSAFSSQLASGNNYTVELLHNIQSNPNSDKEDVLQAADILLKMSSGVEVKNIPNPSVKENKE